MQLTSSRSSKRPGVSSSTDALGAKATGASPVAFDPNQLALEVRGLTKHFGGTLALDQVDFSVRRGTIHALLGGNGSGKSTAIKALAAVYVADAGELAIGGETYDLSHHTPKIAAELGLRFVHQDLGLFDELSIEENFGLDAGYPLNKIGGIAWRKLRKQVAAVLKEYELDIDPRTPVQRLRPSDKTMVAIARALQDQDTVGNLILVLDEPTARLAQHESSELLERIRRRADKGQTVIIVSHRLQEILAVAHDYTVFRDGKVVGSLTDATPTEDELVEIMAGGAVSALRPTGTKNHIKDEEVLRMTGVVGGPLAGVNLVVRRGEIVGIAGLVGSGRSSILQTIFGAVKPERGTLVLNGKEFAPNHIDEAMDAGVAMIPEDRVQEAAFMDLSVSENISASRYRELGKGLWMRRSKEMTAAQKLIAEFKVKVSSAAALFSSMSGGNQQKVVLARWLQRDPQLILLDEPTQGVDVMSRADIYSTIRDAAKEGAAIVVASSDMSELYALCDRVVVLRSGRITDEILAGTFDVDSLTGYLLKDPTAVIQTLKARSRNGAKK